MQIKPGWYKVLKNDIPAEQYWTCGDGCCQDWLDRSVWYPIGEVIFVTESELGPELYEVGSDYEGKSMASYKPKQWLDYVKEGYLTPAEAPAE
ncbi:MAG TPA: hypothetical protein VHU81_21050 [Thermoanaerobaculia bacterium]|jgi:hypothetical protein|nr:hypothetical protein [Thermoanaerobaculia bacterium]